MLDKASMRVILIGYQSSMLSRLSPNSLTRVVFLAFLARSSCDSGECVAGSPASAPAQWVRPRSLQRHLLEGCQRRATFPKRSTTGEGIE